MFLFQITSTLANTPDLSKKDATKEKPVQTPELSSLSKLKEDVVASLTLGIREIRRADNPQKLRDALRRLEVDVHKARNETSNQIHESIPGSITQG